MTTINRRAFLGVSGMFGLALLSACSNGSSASSSSNMSSQAADSGQNAVSIGTLATEDLLPFWVAESKGLFDESGLTVNIVPFQSATELISGISSGEVELAMTDIMVTASMFASGVNVQMQWVTLGTAATQGRFGIMTGPDSSITKLTDLAGVPIGVGSNTILEYVMDKLMEGAGVSQDQIIVEELQKLPVRYQAMLSGEVAAAALPGTLLALGEASGCKLVADDTQGDNLSQSVMISRADLLTGDKGAELIAALEEVWNTAAKMVNDAPEDFRDVLIANANLPAEIAGTYPISAYPMAQLPTSAMVNPVLSWMEQKNYLTKPLSYDESNGSFSLR